MDPISNVDRILLILRQRLGERAKAEGKFAGGRRPVQPLSTTQSIAALLAIDGVDERQLRRTLIQSLIVKQLGPDLINDARFQQVVGQVSDAIEEDNGARKLLDQVIGEFKRN